MLRPKVTMRVVNNGFSKLAKETHDRASMVVRKCAFDLQAKAQTLAAVDTGAMKNSIGVTTGGVYGDYEKALAAAQAANPAAPLFATVQDKPSDLTDLQAIVAVGAEYGIYVEMGHVVGLTAENGSVSMAARPFMGPAADAIEPVFEQAMAQVLPR